MIRAIHPSCARKAAAKSAQSAKVAGSPVSSDTSAPLRLRWRPRKSVSSSTVGRFTWSAPENV